MRITTIVLARAAAPLVSFCFLLFLTSCDSAVARRGHAVLQSAGFADVAPPASVTADIICDRPACSDNSLTDTLAIVLAEIGSRPGSVISVWMAGQHVTEAVHLGERRVPPLPEMGGDRVRAEHISTFVTAVSAHFRQAAQEHLEARTNSASPLAETLMRVAMTRVGDRSSRQVRWVISDARQVVRPEVDFECGALPSPEAFTQHLHRAGVLTPGALRGTDIIFTHAAVTPVDDNRCLYSIARSVAVKHLWEAALIRGSARSVRFRSGALSPAELRDLLDEVQP